MNSTRFFGTLFFKSGSSPDNASFFASSAEPAKKPIEPLGLTTGAPP